MREMELLQFMQMSGGSLTLAVCLLGLFAVAIFRRHAVTRWGMFRLAYIFLALAIFLPAFLSCWLHAESVNLTQTGNVGAFMGRILMNFTFAGVGPLCQALCVFCAFGSMMPRNALDSAPRPPVKHPLDD